MEAAKSRYASKIGKWVLAYPDSGEVASGSGALPLLGALVQEYAASADTTFFGFGARRRVSQAVLEMLAESPPAEMPEVPSGLWDFPLEESSGRVVDPISKLKWVGEDYETIFNHLGLPEDVYQWQSIGQQLSFMRTLWPSLVQLEW